MRHHQMVTFSHLSLSSVLVESGEAGEVLLGDAGSRLGAKQGICVGRVSHNNNLKSIKIALNLRAHLPASAHTT